MVDTERLFNRVRDIAEEEFSIPKEDFSEGAVMRHAPLSFDDLMMVELMFTIEEEFANCKIDIDGKGFCKCVTFGDVVRFTQTYLEGKERELEEDYKAQDASIAAYEKDKELGSWLADDFHRRADTEKPYGAKRTARARRTDAEVSARKPRKTAAVGEVPIRKLKTVRKAKAPQKDTETKTSKDTRERHGRYRRRKENGNQECGT